MPQDLAQRQTALCSTHPDAGTGRKTMNLILWRHAEAEARLQRPARQLTAKGHKQASQMAHWLREHLPTDHLVIASEAARSQQTACALTDRQVIRPEINPGEPAQSLLALCGQHHAGETLVIVGHQPTLAAPPYGC